MPITIFFYDPRDPYGFMSNFSRHPITIDDVEWPTSEHYFQAMKSEDPHVQGIIRRLTTPGRAKNYAHTIALRSDWEKSVGTLALGELFRDEQGIVVDRTKDHFMFTALVAKFTQHADIRQELLDTGDAFLVENTIGDPYWGNGPSRNGLNKLGRMLMLLRSRLPQMV
jgi:ribA/ribD-fused uncharacterized protein